MEKTIFNINNEYTFTLGAKDGCANSLREFSNYDITIMILSALVVLGFTTLVKGRSYVDAFDDYGERHIRLDLFESRIGKYGIIDGLKAYKEYSIEELLYGKEESKNE